MAEDPDQRRRESAESTESADSSTRELDYQSAGAVLREVLHMEIGGREQAADSEDQSDSTLPSVPGYIIDRALGEGGGGGVYLGIREGTERLLAIKVFHHDLTNKRAVERMKREVDLLERLRLDCVPRIIDHGLVKGRFYVATEYVDGQPITEYCERHGLDVRDRVDLLARVCDAVQQLHDHGVLHRDLKPSNILIEHTSVVENGIERRIGRPMIIDFGIATMLDIDGQQRYMTITAENMPIGSPRYMSPEQARGERSKVTIQTDVYALGATAYAVLLNGETPHDGTTSETHMELLHRVGYEPPREPRSIAPTLPKPLGAVLSKAVHSNLYERYRTASELGADFRRWLRRQPVEAGGVSVFRRACGVVQRHPILSTAVVCLVIGAIAFATTNLAIYYSLQRPYEMVKTPDGRSARLLSVSGNILREWDTHRKDGIRNCELVPKAWTGGRGPIALVSISQLRSSQHTDQGVLAAFDPFEEQGPPLWTGRIEVDHKPPGFERDMSPNEFMVQHAWVSDVFPNRPGREIIVVHQHSRAVVCLRIYDFDGEVLYEVWHDGNVTSAVWNASAGRLVLGGLNAEFYASERGYPAQRGGVHPRVVWAVTPTVTGPRAEWLQTPSNNGTVQPDFYFALLPSSRAKMLDELRVVPDVSTAPEAAFGVSLIFAFDGRDPGEYADLTFPFDANGNQIGEPRQSNQYVDSRANGIGNLPAPEEVKFGDLPPPIDKTDEGE